jgi:hypothetical protein
MGDIVTLFSRRDTVIGSGFLNHAILFRVFPFLSLPFSVQTTAILVAPPWNWRLQQQQSRSRRRRETRWRQVVVAARLAGYGSVDSIGVCPLSVAPVVHSDLCFAQLAQFSNCCCSITPSFLPVFFLVNTFLIP